MALVVLLMMPSLQGYQVNAQVRSLGEEIVAQIRAAEADAVSQGQSISWSASYDAPPYSIRFSEPGTGSEISEVDLPPNLHVTGSCYRGSFTPQGLAIWPPSCGAEPASFEILCFDSNTPANPYGIEITVVVATGQVISTTTGRCH